MDFGELRVSIGSVTALASLCLSASRQVKVFLSIPHQKVTSSQVVYERSCNLLFVLSCHHQQLWCSLGRFLQHLKRHITPADQPLFVLFHQHRADQSDNGLSVGENPNTIRPPFDLPVQ